MNLHLIEFPDTTFTPVEVPDLSSLSLQLNVQNSPLLFGCRSGLCGTCLIEVESDDPLLAPDPAEADALDVYAPGNEKARLACQVYASTGMRIRKINIA